MEHSLAEITSGDVQESKECFYDAMESATEEEELRLLTKAVELDPRNTDAWLRMLEHMPLELVDENIEILRKIVSLAAERLGEKAFLEYAGHFWGFHETRPYMRARAALADALHQAGRIESSAAEVDEMLKLNPSDNQGLRYRQLACHLALSKLAAARKLFDQYPDEFSFNAVFAWARVLEQFLSGDLKKALRSLTAARKQNRFVEGYLLRQQRIPKNLPGGYSPGSKDEALCFAADLRMAWNAHPDAKKWLKSMTP